MSYRDLIAWKKGMELVKAVYNTTDSFPPHEIYGLASQLRPATVSVRSNIAEAQAHYTNPEFVRFLRHARGSTSMIPSILTLSLITVTAGMYPAQRAADMTPVESLRYE
ncbi:MAG TPA: four helix bundle protein [Candidatus Sulfotelmatobacter sp.]|nr:four helix bundle protein [Candidatus Sulfotelmatobacter sp.]